MNSGGRRSDSALFGEETVEGLNAEGFAEQAHAEVAYRVTARLALATEIPIRWNHPGTPVEPVHDPGAAVRLTDRPTRLL